MGKNSQFFLEHKKSPARHPPPPPLIDTTSHRMYGYIYDPSPFQILHA